MNLGLWTSSIEKYDLLEEIYAGDFRTI